MEKILSLVRRCVEDYDMIQAGDRVAVGVSGGKDSLVTLAALRKLSVPSVCLPVFCVRNGWLPTASEALPEGPTTPF